MRTSRFIALLIAAVLLPASLVAQENPKLPSGDYVLKAIEVFAKSPLSEEGKGAAAIIAKFAEDSADVTVIASPKVVPWLARAKPPKFSETLVAAYLAGNVRAQLEGRTNANDSYAGIQQVLKTYAQLKEADKTLDIPEVEKFIGLEAQQQLKKFVEEALKEDEKKPEKRLNKGKWTERRIAALPNGLSG